MSELLLSRLLLFLTKPRSTLQKRWQQEWMEQWFKKLACICLKDVCLCLFSQLKDCTIKYSIQYLDVKTSNMWCEGVVKGHQVAFLGPSFDLLFEWFHFGRCSDMGWDLVCCPPSKAFLHQLCKHPYEPSLSLSCAVSRTSCCACCASTWDSCPVWPRTPRELNRISARSHQSTLVTECAILNSLQGFL